MIVKEESLGFGLLVGQESLRRRPPQLLVSSYLQSRSWQTFYLLVFSWCFMELVVTKVPTELGKKAFKFLAPTAQSAVLKIIPLNFLQLWGNLFVVCVQVFVLISTVVFFLL